MKSSFNDAIQEHASFEDPGPYSNRAKKNAGKGKAAAKDERMLALTAIAGISAQKIPEGKKPVSPELLDKMTKHYQKLKKAHVLWNHNQLTRATFNFFNVEMVTEPETKPEADAD